MLNPSLLRRTLSVALLLNLAAAYAAPAITGVTPSLVQVKRAEQVQISLKDATTESLISVQPGGPYISASQTLGTSGTALAIDDAGIAWVGTASGEVRAYELKPEQGFVLLGSVNLGASVTVLASAPPSLVATTADGHLIALNVATPSAPHEVSRIQLGATPTAAAIEMQTACVALASNAVLTINLSDLSHPVVATRTTYPDEVLSVAVQKGECVLGTAHQGIVGLQNNTTHSRFKTAGSVHAFQQAGDHWLSIDGTAGLSLLAEQSDGDWNWAGSYNRIEKARLLASAEANVLVADESGVLSLIDIHNTDLPALTTEFRLPHNANAIGLHQRIGFALTNNELIAVDFSADAAPLISPLGVNLGGSRRSVVEAGLLYVADWFSGLHIYDITNPKNLHHLSTFHSTGSPKGVLLHNQFAYVADDDQGLQVLDISNPMQPQLVASLPLPGLAYTMKRVDNLLYLAAHRGGLHVINIADPRKPQLIGSYDTAGKSWAVDVLDNFAYVADDSNGVLVFDVTRPEQPLLVGGYNPGGTAEDIIIRDGLAYVTFFDQGLAVLDLKQRARPRLVSQLAIAGNARGIVLRDKTAFISAWQAGVIAIDIGNPHAPRKIGQYDTAGAAWGLSLAGNNAFVMDWWGGVRVLDVTDPALIRPVTEYHAGIDIARLAIQRNYLYAASGDQGLQVFDARNALNPVWANAVELSGTARDVAPNGDYAYVAAGRGGLAIVDITTPMQAHLVTQLPLAHQADLVSTLGNRAAVAERNGPVTIVDTRLPVSPQRLTVHSLQVRDITVGDNIFLLATADRGLVSLAPDDTSVVELDPRRDIRLVRAAEGHVYTVNDHGEINALELHGQQFASLAKLTLREDFVDMAIRGNTLYLASVRNGLWVIDYSNNTLRVKAHYPSAQLATSLAINNRGVFLGGPNGVSSGELLPAIEIQRNNATSATVSVPSTMPMGAYDIALHTPGQPSTVKHNAFKIGIGKPKKTSFTMEDLKRVLKQPHFEGQAPK